MAPVQPRKLVSKDRFAALFSTLKTQSYYDPSLRGPGIRTIAWSPLGSLIATGASDKTLRVWNPEKADVKYSTELRGHTGAIEQVAWNPCKEAELASVSVDGSCRFWDVRTKTCLAEVKLGSDGLSLGWAPDGGLVMAGSRKDETLTPISVPSFTTHPPLPQFNQTNRVTFAPSSESSPTYTLLIATGSGAVKICTYPKEGGPDATLTQISTIQAHTSSCTALRLSPNGRFLATGGSDAMLNLWETRELTCTRGLDRPVGGVRNVSFSWDGKFVVAGCDEGTGIEVACAESGDYVVKLETSIAAQCVAWHPSRYWLAWAGEPGGLRIVGAAGGQL